MKMVVSLCQAGVVVWAYHEMWFGLFIWFYLVWFGLVMIICFGNDDENGGFLMSGRRSSLGLSWNVVWPSSHTAHQPPGQVRPLMPMIRNYSQNILK